MNEASEFQPGQYRIMVVDDEATMLGILHRALELMGYQLSTFNSPAQALESIQANGVDLLLTDFHMPGMTGLELIQKSRESGWGGKVVVMSGQLRNLPKKLLQDLGVEEILEKPFSPFGLHVLFQKILTAAPK